MPPTVEEVLRAAPMYRRLGEEDRRRLAAASKLRTYAKGETIFAEGDPSSHFYTVASGRVKIFKMTPTGKDVILEIFGAGDPLGSVAAYGGRPFPASAVALEETVCIATRREEFFRLLEQHPSLVRGLCREGTQTVIPMPLSRQELADLTGTTIETAIRIMSRWGKEGLVRTEKEGFTVLDRPALEVLALS
jgi:CRP/FNR family transcriptional regulator